MLDNNSLECIIITPKLQEKASTKYEIWKICFLCRNYAYNKKRMEENRLQNYVLDFTIPKSHIAQLVARLKEIP